jgi:hypothetical protein
MTERTDLPEIQGGGDRMGSMVARLPNVTEVHTAARTERCARKELIQ